MSVAVGVWGGFSIHGGQGVGFGCGEEVGVFLGIFYGFVIGGWPLAV